MAGVELSVLSATKGSLVAVPTGSFALSYVRFSGLVIILMSTSVGNDAAVVVEGEVVVLEGEVPRVVPPKQVLALKADPSGADPLDPWPPDQVYAYVCIYIYSYSTGDIKPVRASDGGPLE